MSRRTPFGALLLILLLLPTPALCTICAAEGCERSMTAGDCPMEKAPDDSCEGMAHGVAKGSAHPTPMGHPMPMGHDCASSPTAATAADCCATAAGREAEVPASDAPAPQVDTPTVQPAHPAAPDLASNADGVPQAMPPPAASRALFTLHSILLI